MSKFKNEINEKIDTQLSRIVALEEYNIRQTKETGFVQSIEYFADKEILDKKIEDLERENSKIDIKIFDLEAKVSK